ncbi:DivIVA domain-containing protein [Micromonospora sp. FIMYZ51]|uniref:DivIVA domain-containing protein n=1 Tax=Micromonospora sp. FIMYZ51 TaxID=3051832 RepID=UPI00311E56CD
MFFAVGAFALIYLVPPSTGKWIIGGVWLLAAGAFVGYQRRSFKFHIGADGLTLRVAGLNRLVPWAEIDTLILDRSQQSTILLLVPAVASTIDRPLTARSPIDGREALLLLDLDRVRQPADEVAAALARFGGNRFVDLRQQPPEHPDGEADFDHTDVLADLNRYADLLRRGQRALESGQAAQRRVVKAEVDAERATLATLPAGHPQARMKKLLDELSATLGEEDGGAPSTHGPQRLGAEFEVAFTTALRGYEKRHVDQLVELGQNALAAGSPARRSAVKLEIDAARAALPVALRGYDSAQVDAYLERLSAALASEKPA